MKAALFLGVGVAEKLPGCVRMGLFAIMACLALSLVGLPLTSGALAKYPIKPLFIHDFTAILAALSGAGSALLILDFLRLLWAGRRSCAGFLRVREGAAWAIVVLASFAVSFLLFSWVSGKIPAALFLADARCAAVWPLLIGSLLAACLFRYARLVLNVPEGEILERLEGLHPILRLIGRLIEREDDWLRGWPVASATLV